MNKFNIIPASSVPSEVSFSVANYIERKERSRLNPSTLKKTILTQQLDQIDSILESF